MKKNGQRLRTGGLKGYFGYYVALFIFKSNCPPTLINNHRAVDRRKAEFYAEQQANGDGEKWRGKRDDNQDREINHESDSRDTHASFDNRLV